MDAPHPDLVLILAPYGRDAELLTQVLKRGGVPACICSSVEELADLFRGGAAAAIIADESLNRDNIPILSAALAEQPSWSDFPLLLLTGAGEVTGNSGIRLQLLEPLGNLTLVERPLRTSTLLSAAKTALRARHRQYQIRDQMGTLQKLMSTARENEEKLNFALEAARLGAWELHLPSKELVSSSQHRRNFGIHPEEPFGYAAWRSSVHPDDLTLVEETMALSFATRTAFESEYRAVRPDGRIAWIFSAGRPVFDNLGGGRLAGVALDITERHKGEEAIRESEAQLRAMADSMPQLAWMAHPDGYIFWYNRGWYEYTGTTHKDMEGWGWERVHDRQMLPQVRERWRLSTDTGTPFEMEFPLRNAEGEFRWFLTRVRPVCNAQGEVVRWFGTNTDIDDIRRAERALRESEELARSVIENSPDCVEVLNGDGAAVLVNAAGCRLLGVHNGVSAEGKNWVDTWEGENQELARHAVESGLAGRVASFEATGRSGDNLARHWEVIVTPIKGAEGRVSRLLCVSRDITARLQAEEELRQTAKLESLGVMAGGIAHDFNNLLTGILGNASMLAETSAHHDRGLAEDIVLAAERASDLTRQMLAYSGKGRFESRSIDISLLVREMLRLIRPALERNVEIDVDSCHTPCFLTGDPGQIQQVIMNLVINAGEAMEGKAGLVKVSTGRVQVDADEFDTDGNSAHLAPGEFVYLEVTDNGKGMDAATRERIFDPFFTTKFTGRGLGLAAVSGIVRGHKGALRVRSEPGVGSTFRVLFPSAGEVVPDQRFRARAAVRGDALILLVEDEAIVQRAASAALTSRGYRVRVAANGREAVDVFRQNRDDVGAIVLDMTMPVMNGEEAITLIREIDADVPVIVCSGFSEGEVVRRFHLTGVRSFLQKPYTAAMLVSKVQSVLPASV